ncbi:uncharacterized protein BXIN_2150 [Babesia sp. Xinjiang]|uniref:uncharacterized protein n=1 Tax=Babesia sp. Xinjiang TaxID=462227 RepID=UPI000A258399|nr:uncharacterized protein BXIN_2150 [Babesia sp. Xinjiang]ORM40483.1 hypothetical protein BXIN_2150 [Babesia sp. Xinjiang]
MEGNEKDEREWDNLPWLDDVAWFCCLNHKITNNWPPAYILTFYFILANLCDVYLRNIGEYALVTSVVFESFFAASPNKNHRLNNTKMEQKPPFCLDSGIACLLENENQLLNEAQKKIVREVVENDPDAKVPGWLKFHIFVGQVDNKFHLVHCTCCAYDFADVLVDILENYSRFRQKPDTKIARRTRLPKIIEKVLLQNPSIGSIGSAELSLNQRIDILWDTKNMFNAGMIQEFTPKDRYRRIVAASSIMLLYTLMPHDYAIKHLGRMIRKTDHQSLIETCTMVDRLLLNFPKESDVWSLKLYITKEFLRRLRKKGPDMIDSVEKLFGKDRMAIEDLLFQVSEKTRMNGRLSWFLWHIYNVVVDVALRGVSPVARKRVLEKIQQYFIRLYAGLLIVNDGYQGIFYIYLHIVRGYPERLKGLREICESAKSNASWRANLEILDKAEGR